MEEIHKQIILNAFPEEIRTDVEQVILFVGDRTFDIHPLINQDVFINGQKLTIPGRIYFEEINESDECVLTDLQQVILNCLYLSHNDGHVRQRKLEKLKNSKEYFIMPFAFQVLGEYVIEILEVLEKQIGEDTIHNYHNFIKENPKYFQKTGKRIVSYWNEYYRWKSPKLTDYVGMRIMKKLKISVA